MSKVTVNDVWKDFPTDEWADAIKIPIVPRRMVEMIIERCESLVNLYSRIDNYDYCAGENYAYDQIINYANSLLKQFEEE